MTFESLLMIVLAGNDEDATLLGGVGQPSKFFLPFGGERVGDGILRAVDAVQCCKAIYVALPETSVPSADFDSQHPLRLVAQGSSQIQSMMNAVEEAGRKGEYQEGDYALVVTGDLPLLSAQALEHFIKTCQQEGSFDCYLGMIPFAELDESVQPGYEIEIMTFRGEECVHSDVWLLRPDSLTEVGRQRMDQILRIRRLKRDSIGDMLRVGMLLLSIVGPQAIPGFIRTVLSMRRSGGEGEQGARESLDAVERMAIDIIKARFGPSLRLVRVCEPSLALGIDSTEQLELLRKIAN